MVRSGWRCLFRGGRSRAPASAAGGAAAPDGNPIRSLLDDAGIPWRLSRAALARRFGLRRHPAYGTDIIEIRTARPIVDGLLWPLSVRVLPQFSPRLPATEFSGAVHFGEAARDNLRLSEEQLTARLGPAQSTGNANTLGRRWSFGAAALSLTVWPADLQHRPAPNPAHEAEPRLKSGCHLWIETGFRTAATARELAWLEGFVPIAPIGVPPRIGPGSVLTTAAEPSELEFVREPAPDLPRLFGRIGCSNDGAALIFCHAQLYLVPLREVIGFRVERLLPGRGSGGSRLFVECRSGCPGVSRKRLLVSSAAGPDESNELARVLAAATGKPFELGDYACDA